MRKLALVCLFLLASTWLAACGGTPAENDEQTLNILNWSEYLPQTVIDQFEEEYGIKVNYDTFSSNEEMLAKLSVGSSQYDLTVATDYMVDIMMKQELLEPIDKENITNLENVAPEMLVKTHDPTGQYFVPYMWGGVVIAVNTEKVNTPISGYKDLWKSEFNNALVVPDDMRSMIGLAQVKSARFSFDDELPAFLSDED
ncbi:PotD/PotF family extracellular solute-binding protein [Ammoniphilus sp. 3BR4]|uniref:ABC transporter substrate-binding protein n=1 Tax=Ammoniphilus sp. 3BR4 TaxID=3158265 RepID=UPI003466CB33